MSKEFFEAFGIEPKKEGAMHCSRICSLKNCIMNKDCPHYKPRGEYPPITAEIVLKLQTIIQKYDVFLKIPRGTSIHKWTLKRCIELEQFAKISKEVKELF